MKAILLILLAYIIGSIPWALIIGKCFYNKDVRQFGSHNLGGTNASRVLGLKAGFAVIILDLSKCLLVMFITAYINKDLIALTGLVCCLGHCYPVFAQFKGGKAVATGFGYILGLTILITKNPLNIIIPALCFFLMLFIFRMVSLASMTSILIGGLYMLSVNPNLGIMVLILASFIIYRHRSNIVKIIHKTESKI